jgi:ferric-dicitrate binding protein FerR (iron transport regulator)
LVVGHLVTSGWITTPLGEPVAVVEQVDDAAGRLRPRDSIRTGEWIETAAGARLAIRFSDGTSVRFDAASRARPLSANVIELSAGALYIDSGPASARFEVRTALGTARDIGTQFEVRMQPNAVRVRVRSGMVELSDGARSVAAGAGTELTMSPTAAVSRPIASHDPQWNWIASVAPGLDIEGMALSEFLDRISREHGWTLQYAEAALQREASSIILHGSVAGLQPRDALEVAIATSGLAHRFEEGALVVTKRPASR